MSLLTNLVFQVIDPDDDRPVNHRQHDEINLNEKIDETSLDRYWDRVVEDLHEDPNWDTFAED